MFDRLLNVPLPCEPARDQLRIKPVCITALKIKTRRMAFYISKLEN